MSECTLSDEARRRNRVAVAKYKTGHLDEVRAKNAESQRKYAASHSDEIRDRSHRRYIKDKMAALNAYGGAKCACCGETLFEGLTIDHLDGGGAKHRRQIHGGGTGLYQWLKHKGYPPGFQVLCGTCNMAKGQRDHCPHQDRRTE
jgi:hypothetical protein